jgi:hypothetical protein
MNKSESGQRKTWLGGYVRQGKRGPTYVIERWVGGVHFHVSTRCRTERAAMKQLERFEVNPAGYHPIETEAPKLEITPELVDEFRTWMLTRKKPASKDWTDTVVRFLADWAEDLEGKDLRDISIQLDLEPVLDRRRTSRKHRIETIKSFCTWLRQRKGLLTKAEDRTLDLPVPQDDAAKTKRRRVVDQQWIPVIMAKLPKVSADILLLQTGTAWHISEVRRFASIGEIVRPKSGTPLAVLVTPHKSGELTRTPIVHAEHLAAAERLLGAKVPSKESLVTHMKKACEEVRAEQARLGIPPKERMPHFRLGVMRHSVLTWAVEMGATPQQASEFAHHRSQATTNKFYIDIAVPTVTVPVIRPGTPEPEKKTG